MKSKKLLTTLTLMMISVMMMAQTSESLSVTAGTATKIFDTSSTVSSQKAYRIPAIVKTQDGKLLAISDLRNSGYGDIGGNNHISIVQRISTDNGSSWGSQSTIISGTADSGFDFAHGDAAVVCDRETGKLLLMCASGTTGYGSGGCNVGRYYSTDNGSTWTGGEMTTSNGLPSDVSTSKFFSSGRILQSKIIRTGSSYRIYSGLCTGSGSRVVYSDDFGQTWQTLGNAISGGDECKVEELPDGSVLLSCRKSGTGRIFNVYKYNNKQYSSGSWQTAITSTGITAASCNGEILLVPTSEADTYVLLQSVARSSNRENVSVYYKKLKTSDNYTTPSYYNTWDGYVQLSNTSSCYSTMCLDGNGKVAVLYEENAYKNYGSSYDIMFRTLDVNYTPASTTPVEKTYNVVISGAPSNASITYNGANYSNGSQITTTASISASDITVPTFLGYAYTLTIGGSSITVTYQAAQVPNASTSTTSPENTYNIKNGGSTNYYIKNDTGLNQTTSASDAGVFAFYATGNTAVFNGLVYNTYYIYSVDNSGYAYTTGATSAGQNKTTISTTNRSEYLIIYSGTSYDIIPVASLGYTDSQGQLSWNWHGGATDHGDSMGLYGMNDGNSAWTMHAVSSTGTDPDEPVETVIPKPGKIYTLKGRVNNGTKISEYYLVSSRQQGAMSLMLADVDTVTTIGPEYYWIISEGPNYTKTIDAPSKTSYYYISSYVGDGYIGYGPGYDYSKKVETASGVTCTDEYGKEFEFYGFHTTDQINSDGKNTKPSSGAVALYFYHKSNKDYRYVAIREGGLLNWYNRISNGDTNNAEALNNYWATDFIFEEVTPSTSTSELGFSITFTRSSNDAYEKNPNNGTPDFNYYATCKLPFAVILPNDVKAYTAFSAAEKHTDITLKELALTDHVLPRETPVLLMMPGEKGDAAVNDQKTIIANPITAQNIYFETDYTKNCFEGTLGAKTLETNEGIYILGKKNGLVALYKANSANMKNNRAYLDGLKLTNGDVNAANNMTFHFEDEEGNLDGISEIKADKTDNRMYDLQGRQVLNHNVHGLYIINGRKVLK